MKNQILLALIVFILTGCATYGWVSNHKPVEHLDRDYTNCDHWSFEQFPPSISHETQTNYVPITSPMGYNTSYIPNTNIVTIDINKAARESALKKCMTENGWRWGIISK